MSTSTSVIVVATINSDVVPESHTQRTVNPTLARALRYAVAGIGFTGRCECDSGTKTRQCNGIKNHFLFVYSKCNPWTEKKNVMESQCKIACRPKRFI